MENQQKPAGEIDLALLFAKVGDFLKNVAFGFVRFLALIRKVPLDNRKLFVGFIAVGAVLGFSYSQFLKKKFYESTMILSSDYLNKRIVDSSIDNLNLLAHEETSKGLAKVLHVSDTLASKIKKFEAKPFVAEMELVQLEVLKEQLRSAQVNGKNQDVINQVIKRIEIENQHAFQFTVRTLSPTAIRPLQEALVNYFKNNEYIKKRIQINQENLVAKKGKIKGELLKLDSLKKVIYSNYKMMSEQSRQGSNNVILSDKAVTNPIEIYTQDIALYEQLLAIERAIFLQPDFEVIDGFTEFDEPASASRMKVIATTVLIAFALAYGIVALRQFDRYLSTVK
ncbi:MAG TPA: hypothetical protein VL728_14965 [Cyclobacteriaceae bacterium]|jgi:hypothetical protein|nr:hypothetical protein [Cyclobacteriaceae bacterium]